MQCGYSGHVTHPPVAGFAEVVALFGVSRTRAAQLVAREDFPEPIAHLRMGKVWATSDLESWATERGRTLTVLPPQGPAGN